jgi:hypothetical protein
MRLAAILAVLLLYAGSAFACPYHQQTTASNGAAVAQSDDGQQLPKAKSGS